MKQYLLNLLPQTIDYNLFHWCKHWKYVLKMNQIYDFDLGEFCRLGTSLQCHQMALCTNVDHQMGAHTLKECFMFWLTKPYICVHYRPYREWNQLKFWRFIHRGHQSGEVGCIVNHKVFLVGLILPQDTYEPRLNPQALLCLTHTHTQNKMCIHIFKILGTPLLLSPYDSLISSAPGLRTTVRTWIPTTDIFS